MTTIQATPPAEALIKARAAAAEHRWQEALELFSAADVGSLLTPGDLDQLGDSAWWTGDMISAIAAQERAYAGHIAAGEPARAARTALQLASEYSHRLEPSVSSGWVSRAQRLLEGTPEAHAHGLLERARRNAALNRGDLEEALEHANRVFEIGTRLADRDLIGLGMEDMGSVLVQLGRVEEGMALLEEAMVAAIGDELSPRAAAIVYCNATIACEDVADYRRAADFSEAAKRWCERQQIAGFPGMCRVRRAEITRMSGAWQEAESEARLACDELRDFAVGYAGEGFYQIGEVRLRLGDYSAAEQAFAEAHEHGRDPEPGLAMLRLAQGRTDAARSLLREALDEPAVTPLERARLLPALVRAAAAAGDLDQVREAADEMIGLAERYGTHALRAAAADSAGQAALAEGDVQAAVESFRQARRIWQELQAPYEAAQARSWLGRALMMGGRNDAAALELRSAIAAFERLGAEPDLKAAHAELETIEGASVADQPPNKAQRVFMFTDVVRSTDLIEAIGDDAWSALLRWHDDTIRHLVIEHRGEILDHAGDGFFIAFVDADQAIDTATAIRRTMRDHRRDHGFAPAIRIGLHWAEARKSGASYSGRGVHAAARIASLADADEILISQDALAAASRPVSHGPLRTEKLRGIRDPVTVATVA
ncbi:MAG TPA: LuxR family transcriptional regulator [Candidatus Limnocylindria bacterium]|nr:LuxR family transcriptional regulator [Candidatus Limnocylindria bacterium]